MIIGIAYPHPPYALSREEPVFQVLGRPHQYYGLAACEGIVDRMYVLSSREEVREAAAGFGYTIMPWELLDKAQGVLPGHQMTNAMMDFIKADLGMDYDALMRQSLLHVNLANVLLRRETLLAMRDEFHERAIPYLYLGMPVGDPLGVMDGDGSMVRVLNDAPIELEAPYRPSMMRFMQDTNFSCEANITPGMPRHFVHRVSELEGLCVQSETGAKLASCILRELPEYHLYT